MNRRILKLKKPSLLSLLLAFVVMAPLTSLQSAVVNGGFDLPDGGIGCEMPDCEYNAVGTSDSPPIGWTHYSPADIGFFYGLYTPIKGEEYTNIPAAPNMDQILYVDQTVLRGQGPNGGITREVGFEQVTGEILSAGTYKMDVAIGNPRFYTGGFDYRGFGGYGLELFAREYTDPTNSALFDDTIFASDLNGTFIAEGLFSTITLSETLDGSEGLFGQALGIRLYNLNLIPVDADGNEITDALSGIGFNNVQLTVSAVPVPAAVWLFGTALLGLSGFNLRRKRAALHGSAAEA